MKKTDKNAMKLDRKAFIKKSISIDSAYTLEKKPLASGAYGSVHVGTHKVTKVKRAVKIIPKFKIPNVDDLKNEVEMLKLVVWL